MAGAVPETTPRFDYPELTCQECAPVDEEVVFSEDEDEDDGASVSTDDVVFSDEEEAEDEVEAEDDGAISPKEAELEEALAEHDEAEKALEGAEDEPFEHTWAPAGHRETLPNGTILEADGTGGVKVIDAPEEEVETEVVDAPEEEMDDEC